MPDLCQNCERVVNSLFLVSRYKKEPRSDSTGLIQQFPFLNSCRDVVSIPETCPLCVLLKHAVYLKLRKNDAGEPIMGDFEGLLGSLPVVLLARGGSRFRPMSGESGLQLREIEITASFESSGRSFSMLGETLSIFASQGRVLTLNQCRSGISPCC